MYLFYKIPICVMIWIFVTISAHTDALTRADAVQLALENNP